MSDNACALYDATVMHQRLRPLRHRLRYGLFCLLLDLDELPRLPERLRLFSVNHFNLLSLYERDHGAPPGTSLRAHVDAFLAQSGIEAGGPVRLLAMPRILGFAFNPLSIYFCEHKSGGLAAIVYEVRNTFGERHRYLFEVAPQQAREAVLRHTCAKRMHVSPFMDMAMRYDFELAPPTPEREGVDMAIRTCDAQGSVLVAQLHARRRELNDRSLLRSFLSHPALGLKVLGAIHWEALRLLLKGAPFVRHPGPPDEPMTVTRLNDTP
ncbi:MAG: DUF1365 domain-containing protein [Proteobacteria bacterium]|nr:DUF1365 domain-containing protein [Pseudomonadota bacterium]